MSKEYSSFSHRRAHLILALAAYTVSLVKRRAVLTSWSFLGTAKGDVSTFQRWAPLADLALKLPYEPHSGNGTIPFFGLTIRLGFPDVGVNDKLPLASRCFGIDLYLRNDYPDITCIPTCERPIEPSPSSSRCLGLTQIDTKTPASTAENRTRLSRRGFN